MTTDVTGGLFKVNNKTLFYVKDKKAANYSGTQLLYIKMCYKPGETVMQYIDTTSNNSCPPDYKMANAKEFAALSPCMLFINTGYFTNILHYF